MLKEYFEDADNYSRVKFVSLHNFVKLELVVYEIASKRSQVSLNEIFYFRESERLVAKKGHWAFLLHAKKTSQLTFT